MKASAASGSTIQAGDFLSAQEACQLLSIKTATLYTYVSRGLLHPVAQGGRKGSRYVREEVENLKARSEARMGHGAVAATAMRWGQPVINTSITEITPEGPRYRGHLAADLVNYPGIFENVAELLWSGVLTDSNSVWPAEPLPRDIHGALKGMRLEQGSSPRMMRVFSVAATALGGGSIDEEIRSGSIIHYSHQLLFAFAGCCGVLSGAKRFKTPLGNKPIAQHIVEALGIDATTELVQVVNAALILSADHELSPPTFSARIAASVGAELHACVTAALATQSGMGLASGCDRTEDMLEGIGSVTELKTWVSKIARDRARLPGFGIESYPHGDPRAAQLIAMARSSAAQTRRSELLLCFLEEVQAQLGVHPRIEMGLAAICAAWGLPLRSASALWGIGRTAGWVAHTMEQRLNGFFLRPRGQFQQSFK